MSFWSRSGGRGTSLKREAHATKLGKIRDLMSFPRLEVGHPFFGRGHGHSITGAHVVSISSRGVVNNVSEGNAIIAAQNGFTHGRSSSFPKLKRVLNVIPAQLQRHCSNEYILPTTAWAPCTAEAGQNYTTAESLLEAFFAMGRRSTSGRCGYTGRIPGNEILVYELYMFSYHVVINFLIQRRRFTLCSMQD